MRLDQTIHMTLNRTLDAVLPAFRSVFSRYDLTEQQWRVLRALWDHDSIGFSDLTEVTLIPGPSLVGVLNRLEARDLVVRNRSKTDRRSVSVSSTPKGRSIAEKALPEITDMHAKLGQALSITEWETLNASLAKLSAFAETNLHPEQDLEGLK